MSILENITCSLMVVLLFANGTAADLLDKYCIEHEDNRRELEIEYVNTYEEYNEMLMEVKDDEMLIKASNMYNNCYTDKILEYDRQIMIVQEEITNTEDELKSKLTESVEDILSLDSKILSLNSKLQELLNDRNKITKQIIVNNNPLQAKEQVQEMKTKMDKVKNKLEKSIEYNEIGEIDNVKYPLNAGTLITSPYGIRLNPITKQGSEFHNGIDLRARMNTTVLAAFNGIIEKAESGGALGNYIVINHGNNIKTVYGHLNKFLVREGDKVKQYEPIALSGNTGTRTTGPHLHYSIYINNNSVDPAVIYNK